MTTTYAPYHETAPKTTDLAVLRAELTRVRETYGTRSSQGAEAYNRLSAAAGAQGQPLDGLRRHTKNEVERFFAQTIPGLDDHVYWDGTKNFRRNDDKQRTPGRWWWEHLHGPITIWGQRLYTACGEKNCINPEHQELKHFREGELLYTNDELIGYLQVAAVRLGRSPTQREWSSLGFPPSFYAYDFRFGNWNAALKQAGLATNRRDRTPADCIAALRFARNYLNRWPTSTDLITNPHLRAGLVAAGLPTATTTIYAHLGPTWADALRKAGKQ